MDRRSASHRAATGASQETHSIIIVERDRRNAPLLSAANGLICVTRRRRRCARYRRISSSGDAGHGGCGRRACRRHNPCRPMCWIAGHREHDSRHPAGHVVGDRRDAQTELFFVAERQPRRPAPLCSRRRAGRIYGTPGDARSCAGRVCVVESHCVARAAQSVLERRPHAQVVASDDFRDHLRRAHPHAVSLGHVGAPCRPSDRADRPDKTSPSRDAGAVANGLSASGQLRVADQYLVSRGQPQKRPGSASDAQVAHVVRRLTRPGVGPNRCGWVEEHGQDLTGALVVDQG